MTFREKFDLSHQDCYPRKAILDNTEILFDVNLLKSPRLAAVVNSHCVFGFAVIMAVITIISRDLLSSEIMTNYGFISEENLLEAVVVEINAMDITSDIDERGICSNILRELEDIGFLRRDENNLLYCDYCRACTYGWLSWQDARKEILESTDPCRSSENDVDASEEGMPELF